MSFKADVFDLIVTNDVIEHIPDVNSALAECARVLKPGGVMISTFPFSFGAEYGIVKAILDDGAIRYITEPEYHGNPMRPAEGSLVFEIPGWDIIKRAIKAGFSDAGFALHCSAASGILGKDLPGVFVFFAKKNDIA